MTEQQKQTKRGMSTTAKVLIIFAVLGLIVIVMIIGAMSELSDIGSELGAGFGSSPQMKEVVIHEGVGEDKIAVVTIDDAIDGSGSHLSGSGLVYPIAKQLRKAADDSAVKAVILQMNSPGGGLAASDILHNEVRQIRGLGKPVVVSVGGLAASGGYYISCAGSYIIAGPTSLIGSIGVIMQHFVMKELLEKIGIEPNPVKSTESKDIGSPFRDMTPGERVYFENLLKTFHTRFVILIAENRDLDEAAVWDIANGKIYTAEESLEFGLIDEIGYFDAAVKKANELGMTEDASLIKYTKGFDLKDIVGRGLGVSGSISLEDAQRWLQAALDLASIPQIRAVWNGRIVER